MKKAIVYIVFLVCVTNNLQATHNRAGEITYKHISGLTYEFTITTYTYAPSPANRSELEIEWGDNTSSIAPLISRISLPNDYLFNIYTAQHTFPGGGVYQVLVQDPNRNAGVKNIPNSVNVVFSIKTVILINSTVGSNNSPVLLNPPKDRAALGHLFIHNPAAFDPDGDSLSYELTVCTEFNGKPIQSYSLPPSSDTLFIDKVSGDLIWNTPADTGKYNVAFYINEWRNGIKIGSIIRDMQIDVFDADNDPPQNTIIDDICVEAGEEVDFLLSATDINNDYINMSLFGGPFTFEEDSAIYKEIDRQQGFTQLQLTWQTNCSHIRRLPYQIVVKSEDTLTDIALVDIDRFNITVIAPAPTGLTATSTSTEIMLNWDASMCPNASGYAIYRRQGNYNFIPDSCENGVPGYTGFVKIAEVNGLTNTSYIDGNDDEGLAQGVEYCYRITALFPDGAESYTSESVCTNLIPGLPALLNTSVTNISASTGEIFLSWAKPKGLDTIPGIGPNYVYYIYRSDTPEENDFILIDSVKTITLNDTTYFDQNINTTIFPYYYQVKLFNDSLNNKFEIGENFNEMASTLYLDIEPDDNRLTINFKKRVPWINNSYIVYKQNSSTLNYDSVAITSDEYFIDSSLVNGIQYCYQVKSYGWRPIDSTDYYNENFSHIGCGIPQDLTPPCPPELTVSSNCDSIYNKLIWTNPNNICSDDVIRYDIYYSPTFTGEMDSIHSTFSATDTIFYHYLPGNIQLAGCYYVIAVDSVQNRSLPSNKVCIDECYLFQIPNVFTPNGDGINDSLIAYNLNNAVENIDIKIYNRWGQLVFKTNNPKINWDGIHMKTNSLVPSGVYYYICDVYEPRLMGPLVRNISGFVHVYTDRYEPKIIPE